MKYINFDNFRMDMFCPSVLYLNYLKLDKI